VPRAQALVPASLAAVPRALVASLLGSGAPPPWMLPRQLGPYGGPTAADEAAQAAARRWRERGSYKVEAFVDAPNRPPWRDRIVRTSGYVEALLV
jgi:hypothetical protein